MAREVGLERGPMDLKSFSAVQSDGSDGRVALSWVVAMVDGAVVFVGGQSETLEIL